MNAPSGQAMIHDLDIYLTNHAATNHNNVGKLYSLYKILASKYQLNIVRQSRINSVNTVF